MSGGVDSSVAAARLADAGHDVVGLSMQLYDQREGMPHSFGRCCTLDDLHDARRVASAIGIPHYVLNLERQFQATVVDNFVSEYAAGRTPIPCSHCNSDLKFATLVDRAAGFGADIVATGHYARVERTTEGRFRLLRGKDPQKDQSYFLFALTQAQLAHAAFPVGELNKSDVRAYAHARGLPVADKPDSQEICFVPDGDYARFVEQRLPDGTAAGSSPTRPATSSAVTTACIATRSGSGRACACPRRRRSTCWKSSRTRGRSSSATAESLETRQCEVQDVNWTAACRRQAPIRVGVQIRHRHEPAAAAVTPTEAGGATVTFEAPQRAVTPGQAAVFYDGDEVVGGGWIANP